MNYHHFKFYEISSLVFRFSQIKGTSNIKYHYRLLKRWSVADIKMCFIHPNLVETELTDKTQGSRIENSD